MTSEECSVLDCPKPVWARGLCNSHYRRWHRSKPIGGLIERPIDTVKRMLQDRPRTAECWEATWSARTSNGYPQLLHEGKVQVVGRVVMWLEGHDMPDPSHQVLHSCDNKSCFNPAHLRWGTVRENVMEAIERGLRDGFPGRSQVRQ